MLLALLLLAPIGIVDQAVALQLCLASHHTLGIHPALDIVELGSRYETEAAVAVADHMPSAADHRPSAEVAAAGLRPHATASILEAANFQRVFSFSSFVSLGSSVGKNSIWQLILVNQ